MKTKNPYFKHKTVMKKDIATLNTISWIVILVIFASYAAGVFVANLGIKLPF